MCPYTKKTSGLLVLLLTLALMCDGKITRDNLPGLNICGKPSTLDLNTRVINGKPAELGAYPWMALIGYFKDGKLSWDKGAGSLITDQYVITAAHCLSQLFTRKIRIRLGELDLDPSVDDKATPQDFSVEEIKRHSFTLKTKDNDIALIKLKGKVSYTDHIKPICLPPPEFQGNLFVGYNPTIAGWGMFEMEGNADNTRLREAEVEIKNMVSCRTNLTSLENLSSSIIDDRILCASAPDKDACAGDSGGPMMLVQNTKESISGPLGNYFLIGIISYGHHCALEGYPAVYTRVTEFMHWILENMNI